MDRVNIDSARIAGLELHGQWQATRTQAFVANHPYLDSEQKGGANQSAPLTLTPGRTANPRAEWKASQRVNWWSAAYYYGKEGTPTVNAGTVPACTFVDLRVNCQ